VNPLISSGSLFLTPTDMNCNLHCMNVYLFLYVVSNIFMGANTEEIKCLCTSSPSPF
jgi:hypothetical protein